MNRKNNGHNGNGGCRFEKYLLKTRKDFPEELGDFPLVDTRELDKTLKSFVSEVKAAQVEIPIKEEVPA